MVVVIMGVVVVEEVRIWGLWGDLLARAQHLENLG